MIKTIVEQTQEQLEAIEKEIDSELDMLIQIHEERPDLSIESLIKRQEAEFVVLLWDRHLKRKLLRMFENRFEEMQRKKRRDCLPKCRP